MRLQWPVLLAAFLASGCLFQPDCDDGPWFLLWHEPGSWEAALAAGLEPRPAARPGSELPWEADGTTELEREWGLDDVALMRVAWVERPTLDLRETSTRPYILVEKYQEGIMMEGRLRASAPEDHERIVMDFARTLTGSPARADALTQEFLATRADTPHTGRIAPPVEGGLSPDFDYFIALDPPLDGLDALVQEVGSKPHRQVVVGGVVMVHYEHLQLLFKVPAWSSPSPAPWRASVSSLDVVEFVATDGSSQADAEALAEQAWAELDFEPRHWEEQKWQDNRCGHYGLERTGVRTST